MPCFLEGQNGMGAILYPLKLFQFPGEIIVVNLSRITDKENVST